MSMVRKNLLLILTILLVFPFNVFTEERGPVESDQLTTLVPFDGVKIIDVSSSRKSIQLGIGSVDKIEVGDRAELLFDDINDGEESKENMGLYIVAEIEAVKVMDTHSIWLVTRLTDAEKLKKGKTLTIITLDQIIGGKRPLRVFERREIGHKNEKETPFGTPYSLIKLRKKYKDGETLLETDGVDRDMTLTLKREWDEDSEDIFNSYGQKEHRKVKRFDNSGLPIKKLSEKEKIKIFDSSVDEIVGRTQNDEMYIKRTYRKPVKYKDARSTSEKIKEIQEREQLVVPGAIAKMEREGDFWSSSMNDNELRKYMVSSGIASELERRKKTPYKKSSEDFSFRFNRGFISNATNKDANNRGMPYSFGISYEYYLLRALSSFEFFSISLGYDYGISYYDMSGSINAASKEYSFRSAINWYLFDTPDNINKWLYYVGGGFRYGEANLTPSVGDRSYNYSISSFPSYHLGARYRMSAGGDFNDYFKFGVGFNALVTFEMLELNAGELDTTSLYHKIETYDLRLALGMNIYF